MWVPSLGWEDLLEKGIATHSSIHAWRTLWTVACRVSLSMGFSRQEYWSGLPFPFAGDPPDPLIQPASLKSPALAGSLFTTSAT